MGLSSTGKLSQELEWICLLRSQQNVVWRQTDFRNTVTFIRQPEQSWSGYRSLCCTLSSKKNKSRHDSSQIEIGIRTSIQSHVGSQRGPIAGHTGFGWTIIAQGQDSDDASPDFYVLIQ